MVDRGSSARTAKGLLAAEAWPGWRWAERGALVLTLGIVVARGMMLEVVREAQPSVPGGTAAPTGAGPAASMVLNLLACLPALLILVRRVVDRRYRLAGAWTHVFGLALGVWALVSWAWAADRFATLVGATTLLSAVATIWSTAQLVRDWGRLRVVVGVCFGLLMVYLAAGLGYRYLDLPLLVERWENDTDGFRSNAYRERGWAESEPAAARFDRKIRAGEMIGFAASPNTFAAIVVTLGVVVAGVIVQRAVRREPGALALPLATLAVAAWLLVYTGSKTAAMTPVLAAALLALVAVAGSWMARHRRLVFVLGLAGFFLGVLAVVGHGLYHDSLIIESLTFRWRYWVASARLFVDHPFLGVGYANFGDFYTQYRLPIAAEEIRDPHNLFVRFFTELGLIGGGLALAWEAMRWWAMTRPGLPDGPVDDPAEGPGSGAGWVGRAVAVAASAWCINLIASVDFAQDGGWVFLEVLKKLLYAGLIVLGVVLATVRVREGQVVAENRAAPWLVHGATVATAVFMFHSLIDFAFFEAGSMFVFALLTGAVIGIRRGIDRPLDESVAATQPGQAMPPREFRETRATTRTAQAVLVMAVLLWLTMLVLTGRIVIAEDLARRGDAMLRANRPDQAMTRYLEALDAFPSNADYAHRAATAMIYARRPPDDVRRILDRGLDANPRGTGMYLLRARHWADSRPGDLGPVLKDLSRALELNPQEIDLRIEYARALATAGMRAEALAQAEAALSIHDAYHPEEPERLSVMRLAELRQFIAGLR